MSLHQTYTALTDHLHETGYMPSIRELGKRLGLTSSSSVKKRLAALTDAGWIERGPGPRQIRLIGPQGESAAAVGEVGAVGSPGE